MTFPHGSHEERAHDLVGPMRMYRNKYFFRVATMQIAAVAVVQSLSRPDSCSLMEGTPGFPVFHRLLALAQIHVLHGVGTRSNYLFPVAKCWLGSTNTGKIVKIPEMT